MKTYGILFVVLIIATILFITTSDSVETYEPDTALKLAIAENDTRGLLEAIEHGADVNTVYHNTLTPLLYASAKGDVEMVEMLLKNGANIGSVNKLGQTALMVAFVFSRNEVAKLLLDRGIDPLATDVDGRTAMDYARVQRNHSGIALLKKYLNT